VRILVAIDGSSDARAAVGWLGRLPLPSDHTVRVVTVVVPPIAFIDVDKAQAVRAGLIGEARRLIDDTASEPRVGGHSAQGEVVLEDDAREAIAATALEWGRI
jgi:nucleotide-binding universal stress UspA family protein